MWIFGAGSFPDRDVLGCLGSWTESLIPAHSTLGVLWVPDVALVSPWSLITQLEVLLVTGRAWCLLEAGSPASENCHLPAGDFFFCFCFSRLGFSVVLAVLQFCRPGWLRTQRLACLCRPGTGIKSVRHHSLAGAGDFLTLSLSLLWRSCLFSQCAP